MQSAQMVFDDCYNIILANILYNEPSQEDVLHFLGALLVDTFKQLKMSDEEKKFYLETYNEMARINNKQVNLQRVK